MIEFTPLVLHKGKLRPKSGTKEYKKWRYFNFYRQKLLRPPKDSSSIRASDPHYMMYYHRKRRESDLQYKLINNLRVRLRKYTKGLGFKWGSAAKDLGCNYSQLLIHLESQFHPGMSWDNYGQGKDRWSIDHIRALSMVDLTNPEEFKKLNHYSNLRPLWNKDQLIVYHKEQKKSR